MGLVRDQPFEGLWSVPHLHNTWPGYTSLTDIVWQIDDVRDMYTNYAVYRAAPRGRSAHACRDLGMNQISARGPLYNLGE